MPIIFVDLILGNNLSSNAQQLARKLSVISSKVILRDPIFMILFIIIFCMGY